MSKESHSIKFNLLKERVKEVYLSENNASTPNISEWKGQDITNFQEDFMEKVRGSFSEKWFYTYFKNDTDKLPRIDMLNLLSQYAGYKDWNDFLNEGQSAETKKKFVLSKKHQKIIGYIFSIVAGVLVIFWIIQFINRPNEFKFCFIDAETNQPISKNIEVKILKSGESEVWRSTKANGCFSWLTQNDTLLLYIKSSYHKNDTVKRIITTDNIFSSRELVDTIELETDNYAMILRYYLTNNEKQQKKQKVDWYKILDKDVEIYQSFGEGLYPMTREEFVNLMTLPTSTLKNIEIISQRRKNDKIIYLKFKEKENEENL